MIHDEHHLKQWRYWSFGYGVVVMIFSLEPGTYDYRDSLEPKLWEL